MKESGKLVYICTSYDQKSSVLYFFEIQCTVSNDNHDAADGNAAVHIVHVMACITYWPPHHITTVLRPFFRDHLGEPVPEENFWTLWCKGRLTEANTLSIQLGDTPSGLTSAHLHQ